MTLPAASNESNEALANAAKAEQLLSTLLRSEEVLAELEDEVRPNTRQVYTKAPTLWMMILQRLYGGLSFREVVARLLEQHRDLLPKNRRVEEHTLSYNTSAYNAARKRLTLKAVEDFSLLLCNTLAESAEPVLLGHRAFIIDGTTITLAPTEELAKAFPPASNQHGESVWPVAQLLVAHELQTGCAVVPQIDPMYGPNNVSEAKQAARIVELLPNESIILADTAFGIFQVAWSCVKHNKKFLFCLSKVRFNSHLKKAELVEEGDGFRTYQLLWKPSDKELKSNPELPADAEIRVFIHQVVLPGGKTLELVSNLEVDAKTAGALYKRRYDVEFDIRDVKVTLETERIRAKSVDMMMKELLASIIAYNLVVQFRRQAAKIAGVPVRELSFTGVWKVFQIKLLEPKHDTPEALTTAYQIALLLAAQQRLPHRKAIRSYPRVAHSRRPKTTKYQKQLAKQKRSEPPETPPG